VWWPLKFYKNSGPFYKFNVSPGLEGKLVEKFKN